MLEAGEHGELEPFSATACQSNTCTMHVVCRTRRVADCYWVNIAFVDEEKNPNINVMTGLFRNFLQRINIFRGLRGGVHKK